MATSSTVQCTQNGNWGTIPQCIAIRCQPFTVVSPLGLVDSNGQTNVFGDSIQLQCDDGYTIVGSETITCQSNGEWSVTPSCSPNPCTEFTLEPNSSKSVTESQGNFKDEILVTCDEGYTYEYADVTTEECKGDTTWTSRVNCIINPCTNYQVPQHATVVAGNTTTSNFGDTIRLSCNNGYMLNGNALVTCQADGSWSASPSCTNVECPAYVVPAGSNKQAVSESTGSFVGELSITCNDGYQLRDASVSTELCQADGSWTQRVQCEAVMCDVYTTRTNMVIIDGSISTTSYGNFITLGCDDGYDIVGARQVTCQTDGSWTDDVSCQPKSCSMFVPGTGSHKSATITTGVFMEDIKITCDDGYQFKTSSTTTELCLSDGSWTNRVECVAVSCETYVVPQFATIVSGNQGGSVFTDEIVLSCDTGYGILGIETVSCKSDGSWTESPTCAPIQCIAFSPNVHETASVTAGKFMDQVVIICDVGYEYENEAVTTEECLSDGSWTNRVSCQKVSCGDLQSPPDTRVVLTNGSRYMDVIVFSCQAGYELPEGTQITITCTENKVWTPEFTCGRVSCGAFTTPSMSTINQTGSLYEDIVDISCTPGYSISGANQLTCQNDGSWETPGTCEPIDCSVFIPPADAIDSMERQVTFGETVDVQCSDGYVLVGMSPVQCQTNGVWPDLECAAVNCTGNVTVQNSVISYLDLTSVSVECIVGYALQGNTIVNCVDGTWEEEPICVIKDCGAYPNIANGSISNMQSTSYLSVITVSCNVGFELDSDSNGKATCDASGNWSLIHSCNIIDCGSYNAPNQGYVTDVNHATVFETEINIMCVEGYTLSENIPITCQANGLWSTSPTCDIVDCGIPQVSNGILNASETAFNTVVSVDCEIGYNLIGTANIACQSNGTWTELPECRTVSCGLISVSNFETAETTYGTVYGDHVNITCDTGYLIYGQGSALFVCGDDGSWNKSLNCQPRDCEQFEVPANSLTSSTGSSGYKFGDVVNFDCDSGYILFGNASVGCQVDGSWELPRCIACPNFEVANGSVNFMTSTADVICNEGFDLIGNNNLTCLETGQWSDEVNCVIKDCNMQPNINNGVVNLDADMTTFGATARVNCNEGYIGDGTERIECLSSGQWGEPGICNVVDCGQYVSPSNAIVNNPQSDTHFNATITVSCDNGFEFADGNTDMVTCESDGQWHGSPECVRVRCITFDVDDNTVSTINASNIYVFGDSIEFACVEGFTLDGNEVITCQAHRLWTLIPICFRNMCVLPVTPTNSSINPDSATYYFNDTVNVSCDLGFMLDGVDQIRCLSDGNWTTSPSCARIICETFIKPENSIISVSLGNHVYESVIPITCENGYNIQGEDQVECQANGTWTAPPTCAPIDCGQFTMPDNGEYQDEGTTFDSIVFINCNDGYTIDGIENSTCLASGNWSELGACVPVDCGSISTLGNIRTLNDNNSTTFGTTVTFACLEGHTFVNANSTAMECMETGMWSEEPVCEPVPCSLFDIPTHAILVNSSSESYVYGDIVYVQCNLGSFLNGSSEIECVANGMWTNLPTCEQIACPSLSIDNATLSTSSLMNVTVYCDDVFDIVGPTTVVCQDDSTWTEIPFCNLTRCGELQLTTAMSTVEPEFYFDLGTTVELRCETGFTHNGSNFATCMADGMWEVSSTCEIVDCGSFTMPDNGDYMDDGSTFGSSVVINCTTGYSLDGMGNSTCLASGNWSESGACVPVDCGSISTLGNKRTLNDNNSTTFGSTVTYACLEGHTFVNANITAMECMETGMWSEEPVCEPVPCSLFDIPTHAILVNSSSESYVYGDIVYVQCNLGSFLNGSSEIECVANGMWTNLPTCEQIACPSLSIDNATLSTSSLMNVTVYCDDVFDIVGPTTVVCQDDSTWTEIPFCNLTRCGELQLTTAMSTVEPEFYFDLGTTVELRCETGFTHNGLNFATCMADGMWEVGITCEIVDCGEFVPQNNTFVVSSNSTLYNATLIVDCIDGYDMSDNASNTVMCTEEGLWIHSFDCVQIECEPFDIPANGTVGTTSGSFYVGHVITVNCDIGFSFESENTATCQQNGTWTYVPSCLAITCDPQINISNATVSSTPDTYFYNDTLEITCAPGFELNDASTVMCLESGNWSTLPSCIRIKCENYTSSIYTVVTGEQSDNEFGDVLEISCISGYILNGSSMVECLDDGSWSQNSQCDIVDCGDFVAPQFATIESNYTSYGVEVKLSCIEGYFLEGQNISTCTETGNWTLGGECVPVDCGNFTTPVFSSVAGNFSTTFGFSVKFACDEGYEFVSNVTSIECSDVGLWVGGPECTATPCELFTLPANSTFSNSTSVDNVFGDVVYIDCSEGFKLIGDNAVTCTTNGVWSSIPSCEIYNCPELEIQNATITYNSITNITVTCDSRYTLEGPLEVSCTDNGTWTETPVCILQVCGELLISDVMTINDTDDFVDVIVSVNCMEGYTQNGSDTVTCMPDLSWSGLPTCEIVDCGVYVEDDETYSVEIGSTLYNTSLMVNCIPGMIPKADSDTNVVCSANGTWVGSPGCEIQGYYLNV